MRSLQSLHALPLLLLAVISCSRMDGQARAGQISLAAVDLQRQTIDLTGEWEFYWKKFLTESGKEPQFAAIGRTWQSDAAAPGQGFATYVLTVRPAAAAELALHFHDLSSSYRVFIDGVERLAVGRVSETPSGFEPAWKAGTIFFRAKPEGTQIAVQIANFSYYKGGFWKAPYIGSPEAVMRRHTGEAAESAFLAGSILIMALFFFSFYLLRRRDVPAFYFALFCLITALRTLLIDTRLLYSLFEGVPWRTWVAAEFVTTYGGFAPFIMFMHTLYRGLFSKLVVYSYVFTALAFSALFAVLPPSLYGAFHVYIQTASIVIGIYFIFILAFKGLRKDVSAGFSLAGFAFLVLTGVNDFLISREVIHSVSLLPLGLFGFVLSKSFVMSHRHCSSLSREETAYAEIATMSLLATYTRPLLLLLPYRS